MPEKKRSLIRIYFLTMLTVSLMTIVIMGALLLLEHYDHLWLMTDYIRQDQLKEHKHIIKIEVDSAIEEIYYWREQILNLDSDIDEETLKDVILGRLALMSFGPENENYVFVGNWDGYALVNPKSPQLVGQNLWDLENSDGIKLIQEQIRIAKTKPEGDFFIYHWSETGKPEDNEQKISFIRGMPEWELIIGAGVHLEDIDDIAAQQESILKKNLFHNYLLIILLIVFLAFLILYISRRMAGKLEHNINLFAEFFQAAATSDAQIETEKVDFAELTELAEGANRMVEKQVAAREALHTQKALFIAFMENLPGGAFIKDEKSQYVYVNQFVLNELQLETDEILGKTVEELFDEKVSEEVNRTDQLVLQNDQVMEIEQALTIHGTTRHCHFVRFPIKDLDGIARHLGGITIDVTARKQAEEQLQEVNEQLLEYQHHLEEVVEERTSALLETNAELETEIEEREKTTYALRESEIRFRELFENMSSGVAVYEAISGGERFIVKDMNFAGEINTQFKREEIIGKDVLEVFPGLKEMGLFAVLQRVYLSGQPERMATTQYKDNRIEIWGENYVYKLPTGEVVAVFDDVTEQKKIEDQLRQSQKMEAIGTLAGGIAHDFNNILGAIMGYTDAIKNYVAQGRQPEMAYVKGITAGVDRARELVKRILTFSRRSDQEKIPVKLAPIVKEAIEMLQATLPKNICIRENLQATKEYVLADPTQMHQVIMNLCTNAWQAIGDEVQGDLSIDLELVEVGEQDKLPPGLKPGKYMKLTVKDSGCGMEKDILDRIFEPFFTTRGAGKGTGMGLPLVLGIVQGHGGSIVARSTPDAGSEFQVLIPWLAGEITDPGDDEEQPPRGNERILLVDDEDPLLEVTCMTLETLGYEVVGRNGGWAALEIFIEEEGEFDLVITDLMMPNLNGLELTEKLLELKPDLPIILLTGYNNMIEPDQVEAHGLKELVLKPLKKIEMAKTIRSVLDNREQI